MPKRYDNKEPLTEEQLLELLEQELSELEYVDEELDDELDEWSDVTENFDEIPSCDQIVEASEDEGESMQYDYKEKNTEGQEEMAVSVEEEGSEPQPCTSSASTVLNTEY